MFEVFITNFLTVLSAIMLIYLTGLIASLIMILLIVGIQKLFGCRTLGSSPEKPPKAKASSNWSKKYPLKMIKERWGNVGERKKNTKQEQDIYANIR